MAAGGGALARRSAFAGGLALCAPATRLACLGNPLRRCQDYGARRGGISMDEVVQSYAQHSVSHTPATYT
jgi:hypothetical protein